MNEFNQQILTNNNGVKCLCLSSAKVTWNPLHLGKLQQFIEDLLSSNDLSGFVCFPYEKFCLSDCPRLYFHFVITIFITILSVIL